jgi:hypothetical protein
VLAVGEAECFQGLVHSLPGMRQAVETGDEFKVFPDRHIGPEGEFLGHIPGQFADLWGILPDVIAEALARPFGRRQQAADHPDRGRLAGAVGTEESPDFAARHLDVDTCNGGLLAEALDQTVNVDGVVGRTLPVDLHRQTRMKA